MMNYCYWAYRYAVQQLIKIMPVGDSIRLQGIYGECWPASLSIAIRLSVYNVTFFCFSNLIECVVSALMLLAVIYIMIYRLVKERRVNFYFVVSLFMVLTLTFIIAYSLNADFLISNFLYCYFYNVYFSIIVLKLAIKLIQSNLYKFDQKLFLRLAYAGFLFFQMLIAVALAYSILTRNISCMDTPFLVANAVSLAAAILFAALGVTHEKKQKKKLDENLSEEQQNNPLPRFRVWIMLNCMSQLMVLIQSIIFQVNICRLSENDLTNQILKLFFIFICYHMGILATIFFFHHASSRHTQNRSPSNTINDHNRPQIEMAYAEQEDIRTKMVSL